MSRLEEKLTDQFFDWELYGRGWYIWDSPVAPEPPFRPFHGHYILPDGIPDDGCRPTFLSSLVSKLSRGMAGQSEVPELPIEEDTPEPKSFQRSGIVELQTSLPLASNVSKESVEQLFFSLGHCHEALSFEIIGSHDSIIAQFAASEIDANRLQQQLEANFSEGVFTPQSCVLEKKWIENENNETLIVQFGLSREFMLPIATGKGFGVDPYIGITGALSKLQEGDLGVFQVLFHRVRNPWGESILRSVTDNTGGDFFINAPELAKEAKSKVSRPLFAAVVRIAVKTEDYERTLEIARGLTGALAVFSNINGNEFIPLENKDYPLTAHEEDLLLRQSRRCGMILNSDELISLVHLPSSSVRTPKFKRESKKSRAAPQNALNCSGILFGENHHAGKLNEVRLTSEQRVRHAHVIGASGTGKSTFLFNLIRQDIENGQGIAVLDPHGDLIDKICGCIPEDRIDDVIVLDPSDEHFSIGFNILSAHSDTEKNLLASDLVSVFRRLSTSWGDQMGSVLNNAILAFLESDRGGTLADLRRFLIEPAFRNQFLETVNDPDIVYYWKKAFPTLAGNKSIGSVLTRLDTFLIHKQIRYMVSQKENRLDFADIMNTGKIFLAKLSQGKMGKENSDLMGSLLVAKFQQAAMGRANIPEGKRKNFWLYIDEFHNFITPSMAEILTGARKYRVGSILAHQELRQLQRDSDVASAVLSQSYTRVCFRVGDDDARKLSDGFGFFESKDLQSLPNYEAICRVERADCDFNLSFPRLPEPNEKEATQRHLSVITASREKYAIPRAKIEADQARIRTEVEAIEPPRKKGKSKQTEVTAAVARPTARVEPASPEVEAVQIVQAPQKPIEVLEAKVQPIVVPLERNAEPVAKPKRAPLLPDLGRGGAQHRALQQKIKAIADGLGFVTAIEKTILGGSVDLALEKASQSIACEMSFTTTIDHEIGNVVKCLKAGFHHVAVICLDESRLRKIQNSASSCLPKEETAKVGYYLPETFIVYLRELTLRTISKTQEPEVKFGRKIKRQIVELSEEQRRQREQNIYNALTEEIRHPAQEG